MLGLKQYIAEQQNLEDLQASIEEMGYKNIKKISSRRLKILVPAKDRMSAAEKVANKLGGKMATIGLDAGKPVVDFVNNLKLYFKPIPGSGIGGTAKEDAQLTSLQNQIQTELTNEDLMEIPIKIGSLYYNVAGAATTPGTPKSDFHLLNLKSEEIVWISHKDGSTSKHFQQWGGMSKRSEPNIANHPESKKFVEDVKAKFGGVMPRKTTVSRKIVDSKLANMSVYGNKFGSSMGRQNVTLLLQGPIKLTKKKDYYELTSNHTAVNGEIMTGGYAPVFMAIYKGDRSNYGIKGARLVIQPANSRKSSKI